MILLLLGVVFASCSDNIQYNSTLEIDKQGWTYGDTLVYTYDITENAKRYDLELDIEHTRDYGYANLYVQFNTEFPDGQQASEITSFNLTDNKGSWTGDCSANLCTTTFKLRESVNFTQQGKYKMKISQNSREASLPEINSITFRILKKEDK